MTIAVTRTMIKPLLALLSLPLCVLGCATFHYENGSMVLDERRYPGVMVDVGGYNLFFNCTAPAPHTVLLEAGGGGVSLMWKPVQDLLAAEQGVQVCSYDRAGLGWSDPYPGPYSIEQEVDALHAALRKLKIKGKLILVGGSYGGFMIQLYANKYPDNVFGLVCVDANTVYFFDKHPKVVEETEQASVPWLARIAPSWLIRSAARGQIDYLLRLPDEADNETLVHISSTTFGCLTSADILA